MVLVRFAFDCIVGELPQPMVANRREKLARKRNKLVPETADFTPPIRT
jgi:hypothetical protein